MTRPAWLRRLLGGWPRGRVLLGVAWLFVAGLLVFPPARTAESPSFLLTEGWSAASPTLSDCLPFTRTGAVVIDHLQRDGFVRSLATGDLELTVRPFPLVHYKRVDRCYATTDVTLFLSSLVALAAALAALLWGGRSIVRAWRANRIGDTTPCPPRSAV